MDRTESYRQVVAFHRHECPGAALGLRVAEAALARVGVAAGDPALLVVAETDTCAVDALQVLTGCTVGKRNLVLEDTGRRVFTFWAPGRDLGLRIRAKAGSIAFRDAEVQELAERIEQGQATAEEAARFAAIQADRTARILEMPEEDILAVDEVKGPIPTRKLVAPVEPCVDCGEPTSVETLHDHRGRMVCPACHLAAHGGVLPDGHGDHGHHPLSQAGQGQGQGHGHSHGHGHGHQHEHQH
jgi:formylmethanofuran dehydrogenase subunit E